MSRTTESGRVALRAFTEQTAAGHRLAPDVDASVPAAARRELHPLLAQRWSPTRFDPAEVVDATAVDLLVEAARWAPSAGNSQPWAFVVGRRGDDVHARLVRHLAGSSRAWAPDAAVLLANLAHERVEDTDWPYSEFSSYDLGQAVAHLSLQAAAMGLAVRQFRAFDRDGVAAEFAVPPHWTVTTMAAVGRPATTAPETHRDRRERADLRWPVGS